MGHNSAATDFAAVPTVVGSFPHTEPMELVGGILSRLPAIPAWPQLPARDWLESMYVQYSEGLPGVVIDRQAERIYFQTDGMFHEQLEEFYHAVVAEDVERFAITCERAAGLHAFLDAVRSGTQKRSWLKGQVTGAFSFAMTVTDQHKRAIAYNPELWEVAVHGMAMKARWSARKLKASAENALVVLDEPYLCSYGSAFVNVQRGDVIAAIDSCVDAVHLEGALAGLHCCGNTDWSLVLSTRVDVVNFDAYDYFQGLSLYPAELKAFLARGGVLSWGIVPTSGSDDCLEVETLLSRLNGCLDQLAAKGIDRDVLCRKALLTPTCGLGNGTVEGAHRRLDALAGLSALFRERQGLA